jgi:hypothetical protein
LASFQTPFSHLPLGCPTQPLTCTQATVVTSGVKILELRHYHRICVSSRCIQFSTYLWPA